MRESTLLTINRNRIGLIILIVLIGLLLGILGPILEIYFAAYRYIVVVPCMFAGIYLIQKYIENYRIYRIISSSAIDIDEIINRIRQDQSIDLQTLRPEMIPLISFILAKTEKISNNTKNSLIDFYNSLKIQKGEYHLQL